MTAPDARAEPPIRLANEFTEVVVERVQTRNGARLRISVPSSGHQILLCPLELEALTWQDHELFSRLLQTPHGPEDGSPADAFAGTPGLMGWLEGKRALVVGAGSGIGRAVLEAFRSEGAQVAALELDEAKAERLAAELPGCVVSQGDATSLADARAAVRAVTDAFGGLDVLVNCVGIFDFYRSLADIADDQLDAAFDEVFAVNVKSQLVCVRAALPELRRAGGSVVLTVSTSGFYPGRGGVLYVASKFAVRGCVIALAHELAPEVRVNGVAPGGTLGTELTGPRSLGLADHVLDAAPGREEDLRRRTPLRVALTGEDHAGSYVFLASDRARGITGTVVHSDGGVGVNNAGPAKLAFQPGGALAHLDEAVPFARRSTRWGAGRGPSGGGAPLQDAGLGLLKPPSFGLLTAMVVTAQRTVPTYADLCISVTVQQSGHDKLRELQGKA